MTRARIIEGNYRYWMSQTRQGIVTTSVVEFDQQSYQDFDLEDWLADLLVDHWLAQQGEKRSE